MPQWRPEPLRAEPFNLEHIVRHYTEGWANGYKWKITYWEIWNEADDRPDDRNPMWLGTWRQFCELYDVAAKHLKKKFPHLKIGGYGRCTAHHVTYEMRGEPVPEEGAYRERCFEEFCAFLKDKRPPLDFFSFHGYITPDLVVPQASSESGRDVSTKRPQTAAFIVNDSPTEQAVAFDFGGHKPKSCRIVDAKRTDAEVAFPSTLPPNSFMLVDFA